MQERPGRMLRISERDTIVRVATTDDIRETFYIQFDMEGVAMIPCWVMRRAPAAIYAHFHRHLASEALEQIGSTLAARASLECLLDVANG